MRGSLPRLQQAHLHDEDTQHDEDVRDNVPEAHGVPLKGGVGSVRAAASRTQVGAQSSQTHHWMC